MRPADYSTVAEVPGLRITREGLAMAYARYRLAAGLAASRDVLEVGCGGGPGLAVLAPQARRLVAGDRSLALLRHASREYGREVGLICLDAERLPFRSGSFGLVVSFETLYYYRRPLEFLRECSRVLRRPGRLALCSVNPAWCDFNPSPLSSAYFTATELAAAMEGCGFRTEVFGAFPHDSASLRSRGVSLVKRAAVRCRLVPRTMRGKQLLKRLFFGPLVAVPARLATDGPDAPGLMGLPPGDDGKQFKVIYALGKLS